MGLFSLGRIKCSVFEHICFPSTAHVIAIHWFTMIGLPCHGPEVYKIVIDIHHR